MSTFAIVVTIIAVLLFGAFLFLGAWIDGRRQAVRSKGLRPTTTSEGQVTSTEAEEKVPDSTNAGTINER